MDYDTMSHQSKGWNKKVSSVKQVQKVSQARSKGWNKKVLSVKQVQKVSQASSQKLEQRGILGIPLR
jgi:hypothetical protein